MFSLVHYLRGGELCGLDGLKLSIPKCELPSIRILVLLDVGNFQFSGASVDSNLQYRFPGPCDTLVIIIVIELLPLSESVSCPLVFAIIEVTSLPT